MAFIYRFVSIQFERYGLVADIAIKTNFYHFIRLSAGVLLHNTNLKANVPLVFAIGMEESYETMRHILDCIKYEEHMWKICCDFKVVTFLNGMKKGSTKYPCHICTWDSRGTDQYSKKEYPRRSSHQRQSGEFSVIEKPLVPFDAILLPPLHIKLGLFKNFIKFLQRNNENAKNFLTNFFPKLSASKLKEGI